MRISIRHIVAALLVGICLLPVPLVGDLHIESALIAAVIGCFWSCWIATNDGANKEQEWKSLLSIAGILFISGFPLLLYAVITACFSWHGVGFWILYPVPSVLLGYSIGRMLLIWKFRHRRTIGISLLVALAVGVFIIEFFTLPQVYFFNHVWGGWPGPIYDETVKISWSQVYYRVLTLSLAGVAWWLPHVKEGVRPKGYVILCLTILVVGYSFSTQLGLFSPRGHIQEVLGGIKETDHFTIYYDDAHYTSHEVGIIAAKHEFYYKQIADTLDLQLGTGRKIESYLYAHPWQKKELVGAKFTSYVPIWLSQDQLHIAKPQIEASLKHELVHVMSKQFGNNLFNGSWSIGLIEGLGVALAPSESSVSTVDQVVASEKPYPDAEEMEASLSVMGFWGGRSGVNYTQTGSFVKFLLQQYPVSQFKQAYRDANLTYAYGKSIAVLVEEWHAHLDQVSVDSTDRQIAKQVYGTPSLFEKPCPHIQSDFARNWDKYRYFLAEGDTAEALDRLNQARVVSNKDEGVTARWIHLSLEAGEYDSVARIASLTDSSVVPLLLFADAYMLKGAEDTAAVYLNKAEQAVGGANESALSDAVEMRQDPEQWRYFLSLIYREEHIAAREFTELHHRIQVRVLRDALREGRWQYASRIAGLIDPQKFQDIYFDTYLSAIEHMAYNKNSVQAYQWLKALHEMSLRPRYLERLDQCSAFITYMQTNSYLSIDFVQAAIFQVSNNEV